MYAVSALRQGGTAMKTNKKFLLKPFRRALGLAQSEMADRMGLSLRPYQQLELDPNKVRPRHIRLAESVALDRAIEQKDPELAPAHVREKAIELARLIIGENFRQKARKLADVLLDPG
jgi:transcriptional regulator with XRE-family HTH domain